MKQRNEDETALEFMTRLSSDPEFIKRSQEKQARQQELVAANMRDAGPLLSDLRAMGFEVQSPADLYNFRLDYRRAIPLLIDWLPRMANLDVKQSIMRCLTTRWARPAAARPLIREFREVDDPAGLGPRWAAASGLAMVADDSVFKEISDLLRDRSYGRSREMLALAMANMRNLAAVDVLIEVLDDEDVAGHAVQALGKLKAERARPQIERFLQHPKTWIRNEAKKALKRIDSVQGRGDS